MVDISDEVSQKMIKAGDKVIHINTKRYRWQLWTVKSVSSLLVSIENSKSGTEGFSPIHLILITELGDQMVFPFMYKNQISFVVKLRNHV